MIENMGPDESKELSQTNIPQSENRSTWGWLKEHGRRLVLGKELGRQERFYEVEGERVKVEWIEKTPGNKSNLEDGKNNIFFVGWSTGLGDAAAGIGQRIAEAGGLQTLCIQTRADRVLPNSLDYEVAAALQFLKERGIKSINAVFGHSEGAIKTLKFAIKEQEEKDINVGGVVFLNPVGFYEQDGMRMGMKFAWDSIISTIPSIWGRAVDKLKHGYVKPDGTKSRIPRGLRHPGIAPRRLEQAIENTGIALGAARDITKEVFSEVKASGGLPGLRRYFERLANQVRTMAKVDPKLSELRTPTVMILGDRDPISRTDIFVPKTKEERLVKELLTLEEVDPDNPPDVTFRAREQLIKDTLFPNVPYARVFTIPEHHGLVHWRKDAPRVALYMLNRFHRGSTSNTQSAAPIA